jgi:hypothetical protein
MSEKIAEWKNTFIIENVHSMTDKSISKAICVKQAHVQRIRLSAGIKRNVNINDPDRKETIIRMLEDYWCNYTSFELLSMRYSMNTGTISKYIQFLFRLPLNQSTKTITLKSKIWQQNN